MLSIKIIILFITAFFVVAWQFPSYWNWSIFNDPTLTTANYVLAILILLFTLIPVITKHVHNYFQNALLIFHERMNEVQTVLRYLIMGIVIAVVLFLLRSNCYILGDGNVVVSNLAAGKLISETALGTSIILKQIAALMQITTNPAAYRLLSITSIVCGVVYLIFLYKILQILFEDAAVRMVLFLTAATSGIIILFTGYIESYPILTAWIAVYIYFSLLFINKRVNLIIYLLIYLIGVFWHFWFIIFIPALLYALNKRYSLLPGWIIGLFAGVYAIGLYVVGQIVNRGGMRITIPLVASAQDHFTLFSSAHIADVFNELIIVGPGLPFLLIYMLIKNRKLQFEKEISLLIYAGIPAFLMSVFMDPLIGAVRDWDVLSIYATPFLILAAALLGKLERFRNGIQYIIIPLLLLGVLHISNFVLTNKSVNNSVDRVVRILNDDPHYQEDYYQGFRNSSFAYILATEYERYKEALYFSTKRDKKSIVTLNEVLLIANICCKAEQYKAANVQYKRVYGQLEMNSGSRFLYGQSLFMEDRFEDALELFRTVLKETSFHQLYYFMGMAHLNLMHVDSGVHYFDLGLVDCPDTAQALVNYYKFCESIDQPGVAVYYQSELLKLRPGSRELVEQMIKNFEAIDREDLADYYRKQIR